MPICPKCKTEYREGFKICHDCKVELVDEIIEVENKEENNFEHEWVLLKNVSDGFEYNTIIPLLESNGIHILEKQKQSGQYIKIAYGSSYFGTDIYVLEYQLEEAKKLIEFLNIQANSTIEENTLTDRKYEEKKTFLRFYIILITIVPLTIFVLYSLYKLIVDFF